MFIDAAMPMPELTNDQGKCTMYKQDTKNSSVYNVSCIFEDNYIFVDNFNISARSYQPIPWNCNNKTYVAEGRWAQKKKCA